MSTCQAITFVTPDKYQLNGLLFGADKASRGFIVVHGLGSSVFSQQDTLTPLVDKKTSILFFNNRGHDTIGGVRKLLPGTDKGYETRDIGAAHEVFKDCASDIDGAVSFLKSLGVKDIYLVGHSTGCQKSIYYLSHEQSDVKGVVLLCPVSDYAYVAAFEDKQSIKKAVKHAQKLVKDGKPHELLPIELSESLIDAQRYLSLYTPDSIEEIFPYSQEGKTPVVLQKVTTPILAILAENDEYADRPAMQIAEWFDKQAKTDIQTKIIKNSYHNLTDHGPEVSGLIKHWVNNQLNS